MAVSFIGRNTYTGYGGSSNMQFPSGTQVGDMCLIWCCTDEAPPYSIGNVPSGWSKIFQQYYGSDFGCWVAWKEYTGSEGNPSVTGLSTEWVTMIITLRGTDVANAPKLYSSATGYVTIIGTGSLTTSADGAMILIFNYTRGYYSNHLSGWMDAGSDYTFTEQAEVGNSQGGWGCCCGFATASQPVAEATGTLYSSMASRSFCVGMGLAIEAAASPLTDIDTFQGVPYENVNTWMDTLPENTSTMMNVR